MQVTSAAELSPAALRFLVVPLIAVVVSAITAFLVARLTIRANQDIARKRATLDLIERSMSTEHYLAIHAAFRESLGRKAGLEEIIAPSLPAMSDQRRKVIAFLNHYELIAIGIGQGVLDEDLYRTYMRSTVVRHWYNARPFVRHLRRDTPDSNAPQAFEQFEALALKWQTPQERATYEKNA